MVASYEEYAKRNHGGQSLEKLSGRGGLSPKELYAVMHKSDWASVAHVDEDMAIQWLVGLAKRGITADKEPTP
jgi:hypothetical protein